VLGAQNDYTIEFEVKRAPNAKGGLFLVSNTDEKNKTGLGLKYFPPDYNAIWLLINGNMTVEQRGFLGDAFDKVTLVIKDKRLMLFRNGLIIAVTDEVRPSVLPLTLGDIQKAPITPYELRNIRIYDSALFPTGFDASADRMRHSSGDNYTMQRATIKDPGLPRILVIGDSISMGYRGFITEHFKDRAYVDYWVGGSWIDPNAVRGENSPIRRGWSGVLSNGPYDVVTWNAMGLHCWTRPDRSPEATYVTNMTEIVEHLKKTAPATRFIWVRTTPCRTTPAEGRPTLDTPENARIIRFNTMTDELMARYGIPTVDLYALCETNIDTVATGSKDAVHWNGDVSRLMAAEIITFIEKALPAPKSGK
jgi:hypothetical protein